MIDVLLLVRWQYHALDTAVPCKQCLSGATRLPMLFDPTSYVDCFALEFGGSTPGLNTAGIQF